MIVWRDWGKPQNTRYCLKSQLRFELGVLLNTSQKWYTSVINVTVLWNEKYGSHVLFLHMHAEAKDRSPTDYFPLVVRPFCLHEYHTYLNTRKSFSWLIWKIEVTLKSCKELNIFCTGIFLEIEDCEGGYLLFDWIQYWYS